ncbi:hypothetical protein GFS31_43780 (plasmid) [Leptolyngbya sp. BL0902]|nr:hypothetical protein GFS31_43780 [Leptolyngbya sp. BL0902]
MDWSSEASKAMGIDWMFQSLRGFGVDWSVQSAQQGSGFFEFQSLRGFGVDWSPGNRWGLVFAFSFNP